jgi:hypothetical protein
MFGMYGMGWQRLSLLPGCCRATAVPSAPKLQGAIPSHVLSSRSVGANPGVDLGMGCSLLLSSMGKASKAHTAGGQLSAGVCHMGLITPWFPPGPHLVCVELPVPPRHEARLLIGGLPLLLTHVLRVLPGAVDERGASALVEGISLH